MDDLRRLDPPNPRDRRRARSVGKTDPRRARSHRRNSPRRERVVSYSRNRGKSPRSPTLIDMIRERRSCRDESVVPGADALGGNRNSRSIREIMPERNRATRLSERWDQPRSFREPYDFPKQQKGDFANAMRAMARDSKEASQRTGSGK